MAEEFVDFMLLMKGKSVEEKLDVLIDIVKNIMTIFVKFIEDVDNKIKLLENKIPIYEESIKQIKTEIQCAPEPESKYVPPPHVNKPLERVLGIESTKNMVMKELNALFKKKKLKNNV